MVTIGNESRGEQQSRKFHAMCGDVLGSASGQGRNGTAEQWKLLFVSAHAVATREGSEIVPGIEGEFLNIRESTARMGVKRMASFLSSTSAHGARRMTLSGVRAMTKAERDHLSQVAHLGCIVCPEARLRAYTSGNTPPAKPCRNEPEGQPL